MAGLSLFWPVLTWRTMKEPRKQEDRKLRRDAIVYRGPVPDPANTALGDIAEFYELGCFCSACEREAWLIDTNCAGSGETHF